MTNSNDDGAPRPQAVVAGDLDGAGTLNGRAGASVFSIGGPDGRGGTAGGEPLRVAERFARRLHGDDDTATGANAENPAVPRRGSRVVPPWRGSRPRLLRALHHARRKPCRRRASPTDAGREHVSRRADARPQRRHSARTTTSASG